MLTPTLRRNIMDKLRFNSKGTDATYLANANILFACIFELALFKLGWHEKLGNQTVLQKMVDWFRQMFEGGLTGNRLHIAARKEARKELDLTIEKILLYVAIFGDESDIKAVLNSGVVVKAARGKGRKAVKLVPAP
jgi:hypothetical protein